MKKAGTIVTSKGKKSALYTSMVKSASVMYSSGKITVEVDLCQASDSRPSK